MQIEIDQSGKIEDTSKDTVLALSNGTQFSIKISRNIKRELQNIFRKNKEPRNSSIILNQNIKC